jgi:hypothetical protein
MVKMKTLHLTILLISTLECYALAEIDRKVVCRNEEGEIALSVMGDIVDKIQDGNETTFLVSNKKRQVKAICDGGNKTVINVTNSKGKVMNSNESESPASRIFSPNVAMFWEAERHIQCIGKAASGKTLNCSAKVMEVKEESEYGSNCSQEANGLMWCSVKSWVDSANQEKKSRCINKDDFAPFFRYYVYINESHWQPCNKYDKDKTLLTKDDGHRHVEFLNCNISTSVISPQIIIRMERVYRGKKMPYAWQTPKECRESSMFVIGQTAAQKQETVGEDYGTKATYSAIGLVATAFLIILVVSCWRHWKRVANKRKTKTDPQVYTNQELSNYYSNDSTGPLMFGDSAKNYQRPSAITISIEEIDEYLPSKGIKTKSTKLDTVDQEISTDNKHVMSREEMMRAVLEGDVSKINLDLPLTQQTKILPYNSSFEVSKDNFTISHLIGEGQFGTVFVGTARGIYGPGDTKVAIKQVKNTLDENQLTTIIDELKILSNFHMHINLVNLLGACTTDINKNEVYLLLEYCPFGDLKDFLVKRRDKFMSNMRKENGYLESPFNSKLLLSWCYSISKGMEYLESKNIMHGDLAARNVLVGEHFVAKISDFGLSKQMYYNQDYKKSNRRLIPWAWMATEYLQTGEFNIKSDVWSFGVVLWEIFSLGNKPYGIDSYEDMKVKILSGYRLPAPDDMEQLDDGKDMYNQVMLPCWHGEANKRPKFKKLAAQMETMVGEDGLKEYAHLAKEYNKRQEGLGIQTLAETQTVTTPPGYVIVGQQSDVEYLQMDKQGEGEQSVSQVIGRTKPPPGYVSVEGLPSPVSGYSEATMEVGGYIGLSEVR